MRTISASIDGKKGRLNRYFSRCIGAGRAAEVMRHQAYEQLKQVQRECPFSYIRFHGLFHDEMNVVRREKDGSLVFDFQYIDILFDSLLDIGIRPVVELGLMPCAMAKEEKFVFWWKMNISTAKEIEEWYRLVEATVRHFTVRYGEDEVKKWYFEVWNEPNLGSFFSESAHVEEYIKLYEAAARAVKSVSADYQVGGPASAGFYWLTELVEYRKTHPEMPLDFLTSHNYCVEAAFDPDGIGGGYQVRPIYRLNDANCKWGDYAHENGYPLLMTEWSASSSCRDMVHDSYFIAPFILESVKRCEGHVDMYSYWAYTDIFEEVGPPPSPFHGGFGLLNTQSLPKPSYHAFTFLHRLGDEELVCEDASAYACLKEGEAQILFWNLVHPGETPGNNYHFGRLLPAAPCEDAQVELGGLTPGRAYAVTVETVGYGKGDVLSAYLERGLVEIATREMTAELMDCAKPALTTLTVTADENGVLRFSLPQAENQVDLVRVAL